MTGAVEKMNNKCPICKTGKTESVYVHEISEHFDLCEKKGCRNIALKKRFKELMETPEFIARIMKSCGVPKRYYCADLTDDFDKKDRNVKIVLKYLQGVQKGDDHKGDSDGIFITGGVGSGKSYLCAALAKEFKIHRVPVIFIHSYEIFNKLYAIYGNNTPGESQDSYITRLCNCNKLIIDDLGVENSTKNTIGILHQIIDIRGNDLKDIIVNTNLTMQEISDQLSSRIADRLNILDVVALDGDSRRIK